MTSRTDTQAACDAAVAALKRANQLDEALRDAVERADATQTPEEWERAKLEVERIHAETMQASEEASRLGRLASEALGASSKSSDAEGEESD